MSAPSPSLSVILVCKNPGPRLATALESVWSQREARAEIVVVDGGSTDGSREWLEQNRGRLDALLSEPDRGVYDAMNKGLALATTDWVLFLGADDQLASRHVVSELARHLENTEADVAIGAVAYADQRVYRYNRKAPPLARNFVHHQGACYRRRLFTEAGPLDATFAIMGDYEFNLRLYNHSACFDEVPLRLSLCGTHGLSDAGHWRGYWEEIRVRHRHAPAWRCWGWDVVSVARWLRKKIVRRRSPARRA